MMEKQIHELREVVLANQLLKQQLGELGLLQKQIQKDHEAEVYVLYNCQSVIDIYESFNFGCYML